MTTPFPDPLFYPCCWESEWRDLITAPFNKDLILFLFFLLQMPMNQRVTLSTEFNLIILKGIFIIKQVNLLKKYLDYE